jgi:DNA helicase-2/ATP-dependent DNA helicase PcrA
VLATARSVIEEPGELRARTDGPKVELVACPTAASEAEQILVRLERIVGGTSYFAVDSGRGDDAELGDVGFGDVAVLLRTKAQRREILEALGRSAIPCRAVGEDEPHDPRSEKVAVMTMHAAKGREFEVVFVAGVEPGLVPLELEGRDTDPDEERRLLYVALTRARRLLVLSHAAVRNLWGKRLPGGPSPFLARLSADAVLRVQPSLPAGRPEDKQLSFF